MGQKDGGKWTAAADLQPTISKSDRLLEVLSVGVVWGCERPMTRPSIAARALGAIITPARMRSWRVLSV